MVVKSIQSGDTYTLEFSADYDSALYTPKLMLNDGVNKYEKVGTGDFEITITAAETALYAAGQYAYSLVLFNVEERITLESGFVTVIANLETTGANTKNKYQIIVDAIDASVLGLATSAQKQVTINGRAIERFTPDELIKLRDKYAKLAQTEQRNQNGKPANRKIYVRF
jgi:hypothetical protein